jgi:hypothetical protein
MNANRFYFTPSLREKLRSDGRAIASNQQTDKIFLIQQKLQELALLLLSKRLHVAEIRKRIVFSSSIGCLEQELKEQYEQIEDLTQLAEDWLNFLELLREKPTIKPIELSLPFQRTLISLELQAQNHS